MRQEEEWIMQNDKAAASPFSALTYQEQQARWKEWQARQLNYKPLTESEAPRKPQTAERTPRLRNPNMPIAAPQQRGELNQVLSRHQKALKQAGAFKAESID